MKKLIFLTLMSLFAFSAMGQRYYSLAECGNDPLKYIERNYEDNEARYKGKTVAQFVQECELELYDFVPYSFRAADGRYNPNRGKINGVAFYFYQDDYLYIVPIWFSPPYTYTRDDFYNLENSKYREVWKDIYYQFFKNYKIERIGKISKRKDDIPIKNYRRP